MVVMVLLGMLLKLAPLVLLGGAAWFFFRSEYWGLVKTRLREGDDQSAQIAQLAGELEEIRRELAELQERVDFNERALTQGRATTP